MADIEWIFYRYSYWATIFLEFHFVSKFLYIVIISWCLLKKNVPNQLVREHFKNLKFSKILHVLYLKIGLCVQYQMYFP